MDCVGALSLLVLAQAGGHVTVSHVSRSDYFGSKSQYLIQTIYSIVIKKYLVYVAALSRSPVNTDIGRTNRACCRLLHE